MAKYSCKQFSPRPCLLATVGLHLLQTDGQVDDNHDNSSTLGYLSTVG